MKLSDLIVELEHIRDTHGSDVECYLQGPVTDVAHEAFFVVPEEYSKEDGGWAVNIRTWPY